MYWVVVSIRWSIKEPVFVEEGRDDVEDQPVVRVKTT